MNLPNSMQELIIFLQKNQRFSFIFILVIAFFLFWIWGGNSQEELFKIDSKIAKPEIKSVQDAVDPRAIWADNIAKQIESHSMVSSKSPFRICSDKDS